MRLISAATIASAFAIVPAVAECTHPRIPWTFGSSISSTGRTNNGTPCKTTNNHPENIQSIEIETKPRNGIAGRAGSFGVAYKPNAGFKGSDAFTYVVTSNANYRKGPGWKARITIYVIAD